MRQHRAAFLCQTGKILDHRCLAFKMGGHADDGANRQHACSADTGNGDVVDPVKQYGLRLGQVGIVEPGQRAFFQRRPFYRHEGRTEALYARKVLVAGRLVDLALAAEFGFQRFDGNTVRLDRAIPAAFTDQRIDEGALVRVNHGAAFAAAAFFCGASLVVDDGGTAGYLAQVLLHIFQVVAMADPDSGCQIMRRIFFGFVRDEPDFLHAFCRQLFGELRHGERAIQLLAAGHGNRVVVEQLVGDVGAGGDRLADRHDA